MYENYQYYFNQAITKKSNIEMLKSQHEATIRDKEQSSLDLKNLITKENKFKYYI